MGDEPLLPNVVSRFPYLTDKQKAEKHMLQALKILARQKCDKRNCGGVCLCGPCHAIEALSFYEPNWRP